MKGFSHNGNMFKWLSYDETSLSQTLKPQVYNVAADPINGIYLTVEQSSYDIPALFGNIESRADRILSTFTRRVKATGVLLTGDKGSGKTMLTKLIANKAIIDLQLPVIIVNRAFAGDEFNNLINAIGECVLIFDEIAKVYSASDDSSPDNPQNGLLNLLDGLASTAKRLILFTENNEYHIGEFMRNRPGRIFYHYRYTKLDEPTIKGMASKYLINQDRVEEVVKLSRTMRTFSFDILSAIIEESNLYPQDTISSLSENLNVDTPITSSFTYAIDQFFYEDEEFKVLTPFVENGERCTGFTGAHGEKNFNSRSLYLHDECIAYEDMFSTVFFNEGIRIVAHKVAIELPDYSIYSKQGPYNAPISSRTVSSKPKPNKSLSKSRAIIK